MYKVIMIAIALLISGATFAGDISKDIVGVWKIKEAKVDGKAIIKGSGNSQCSLCDLLNSGIPLLFDASGKVQYGEGGQSQLMFYYVSGKKLILSQSAIPVGSLKRIKSNKEKGIEVIAIEEAKTGFTISLTFNERKETYLLEK